jgi:hypothetical protein
MQRARDLHSCCVPLRHYGFSQSKLPLSPRIKYSASIIRFLCPKFLSEICREISRFKRQSDPRECQSHLELFQRALSRNSENQWDGAPIEREYESVWKGTGLLAVPSFETTQGKDSKVRDDTVIYFKWTWTREVSRPTAITMLGKVKKPKKIVTISSDDDTVRIFQQNQFLTFIRTSGILNTVISWGGRSARETPVDVD